jgi:hypothetical protein
MMDEIAPTTTNEMAGSNTFVAEGDADLGDDRRRGALRVHDGGPREFAVHADRTGGRHRVCDRYRTGDCRPATGGRLEFVQKPGASAPRLNPTAGT